MPTGQRRLDPSLQQMRRPHGPARSPAIGIGITLHQKDILRNHSGQPRVAVDVAGSRVMGGLDNLGYLRVFQLLVYRGFRYACAWHDIHIISAADLPESPVVFARTWGLYDVRHDDGRHRRTVSGNLSLQQIVRIKDFGAGNERITPFHMTL